MLSNKWDEDVEVPQLPEELIQAPGLKPVTVILNEEIGEEIIFLVTEPEALARKFTTNNVKKFMIKSGLVNTSQGPVCFILFYFPNPETGEELIYENIVNPHNSEQMNYYRQLANHEFWHLIISDENGEVTNISEFKNNYGLDEAMNEIEKAAKNYKLTDFEAAKEEYEQTYTIDRLMGI